MSRPSKLLAPCLLLALAPLAPELSAQKLKLAGKHHEDKIHGFRFRPFDEWNQVPPQPGEEITLCSFHDSVIDHRNAIRYETTLEVFKITRQGPETGGDDEEEDISNLPPEEQQKRILERFRRERTPKTFQDLVEQRYGEKVAKALEGDREEYGKLEAVEYEFKTPSRSGGAEYYHFAVVFRLRDFDVGLMYTLPDLDDTVRKAKRMLERSAKTFETIEIEKPEAAEGEESDFDRRLREFEAKYESMPEWRVTHSDCKRYLILIHNEDPAFVREIIGRIEAIRDVLEEDYPPLPDRPITAVSVLRVCISRGEYHSYGGPPGSAGYWNSSAEELVIYDDKNINRNNTWGTLNHEAFHQYIYYRCGEIAPHSWFNEGTGDFYAGYEWQRGRFKISKFEWRLGTVKEAMRVAKEGGKGGSAFVPLKDLVHYTQQEYYSNPGACYSLGWAFVYFLKAGANSRRFPEKWKRILPTYLEVITETKDKEKANEAAFEGFTDEDWKELQDAWVNYRW